MRSALVSDFTGLRALVQIEHCASVCNQKASADIATAKAFCIGALTNQITNPGKAGGFAYRRQAPGGRMCRFAFLGTRRQHDHLQLQELLH